MRIFRRLLEILHGKENPNIEDINSNTPLHLAAFKVAENPQQYEDNLLDARILINFRANVDHMNNLGNTPLHFAVARRNYKMIDILLIAKAQIDLKDNEGNAALHYAINNCALLKKVDPQYICPVDHTCTDWKTVKQLLAYQPDINVTNNLEETPLMWAVKSGDFRIVQELSHKSASQNIKDVYGNTALHFALDVPEVNADIVTELLKHGSYPGFRNKSLRSALDVYLYRLQHAPDFERQKAAYLFKLILLKRNFLDNNQIALIRRNDLYDISYCRCEILLMQKDNITSHISVYTLVSQDYRANDEFSYTVWDKLLAKLLTGKYPIYCNIIASCFPRVYLSHKFAEICRWVVKGNTRNEFLDFHSRFLLSYHYLSNFDIYKIMLEGKR